MKDRKLEFIIPISYLLLLIVYMIIVILVIDNNTQGHSEIYGLIYSISFFVTHPFYSFLLGFLIIIPLPLLVIAIVKKRKDLITGFSISTIISVVLLIIITTT